MNIVAGNTTDTVERSEADIQKEKRDLAVEFIFCLALIEVLKQMVLHPGHEDLVQYIENLALKHFKYHEGFVFYCIKPFIITLYGLNGMHFNEIIFF